MARPSAPPVWDDERPYWMQEPEPDLRSRRWPFLAAGGLVLAGVAGLILWPARSSPPPPAAPAVAEQPVAVVPAPPPAPPEPPSTRGAGTTSSADAAEPVAPPQPVQADMAPPLKRHPEGGRLHFAPPTATGGGLVARWIRAGSKLAKRGQFKSALAAFQRAAGMDIHSADAWYGMALCDYELHRDQAAARAANQAIWADPEHAMGNLLVGFLRQESGHPAEARKFYDRYLAREPKGQYAEELVSVLDQLPKAD